MSAHVVPLALPCHCWPSVPALQVPATLKLAGLPASTLTLAGCAVIVSTGGGGSVTVNPAVLLVTVPAPLLTTARNTAPLSASTVAASA